MKTAPTLAGPYPNISRAWSAKVASNIANPNCAANASVRSGQSCMPRSHHLVARGLSGVNAETEGRDREAIKSQAELQIATSQKTAKGGTEYNTQAYRGAFPGHATATHILGRHIGHVSRYGWEHRRG